MSASFTRRATRLAVAGAVAAGFLVAGAPLASANDDDVIVEGSCSGGSDWKLKLSPENGRIEVEFEVDSNTVGQVWKVKMTDNGTKIFKGSLTTTGPSGSFEARDVTTNLAGNDVVRATAKLASGGESCVGQATFTL